VNGVKVCRSVSWCLSVVLSLGFGLGLACDVGEDEDDDEGEEDDEGEDEGEDEGGSAVVDASCRSGLRWDGGDAESPRMHPGMDCLGCHQERGEAEEYTLGGTVYEGLTEADDCYGVAGVTVELTGADGVVVTMTTNEAGNFTREHASVAVPYTAKLIRDGREVAMQTPQTILSCNVCHAQTGLNMAPGRILAP